MFIALAASMAAQTGIAIQVPEGEVLKATVAARSNEYFDVFFNRCQPERLQSMLSADVEMYHDRNGVRGTGSAPIVARYLQRCAERSRPGTTQLRRELVAGSLEVWPVPGHGAIEQGKHVFYLKEPGKPERKADSGRYLHLWVLTDAGWRLSRVFSYDHEGVK